MEKFSNFFLLGVFAFFLLFSCKDDETENPDPQPPADEFTLLVSQDIGPAGGKVSTTGMVVEIPSGAFAETANLQIFGSNLTNGFGNHGCSDVFSLKGLPQDFYKPLKVSMKYQGSLQEGNYIALGKYGIATSVMDTVIYYNLLAATDSSGYFNAHIPPPELEDQNKGADKYEGKFGVPLMCVRAYMYYQTDHFIIYFPSQYMQSGAIQELGNGLEGSYDTLQHWGFSYTARTSWPLEVTVKDLDAEVFGQSLRGFPWTANSGYIEVNSSQITDHEMIRITGAHEFFHVVQDLYNYDEKYNWLQEASSTWFEKYFSNSPSTYLPSVRDGLHEQPFLGLQAGVSSSASHHGYGCAAVIEYLQTKYGKTIIKSIWTGCQQEKHPVEAIEDGSDMYVMWWSDFLKKYFLGQVYSDMNLAIFDGNDTHSITGNESGTFSFTRSYPDLSGYAYIIKPSYGNFEDNASLKLSLIGNGRNMIVFKKTGLNIEIIGESVNEVIVPELKNLYQSSSIVYVLVTNYLASGPDYSSTSNITLSGELINTPAYKFHYAKIDYQFRGEKVYNCTDTTYYEEYSPGIVTSIIEGTFEGNSFIGSYEGMDRDEVIVITLDTIQKKIVSLNLESTWYLGTYQEVHTLVAHDVPSYFNQQNKYMIVGPSACDKVNDINYTSTYPCTPSLSYWYCDDYSYIDVVFFEKKDD